jgi:hypothetical protein
MSVESSAAQGKAVWICRCLAIFAIVFAGVYGRGRDSLAELAFAVLGYGIAIVLLVIHPGDREWVASVVMALAGLAMLTILLRSLGIEW